MFGDVGTERDGRAGREGVPGRAGSVGRGGMAGRLGGTARRVEAKAAGRILGTNTGAVLEISIRNSP